MPDLTLIETVTIFIATYVVVAVGKVPVYRIDRAGAALLGGSLMLAIGVLTPQEAYRAIDFDTITLLLGMIVAWSGCCCCDPTLPIFHPMAMIAKGGRPQI